MKRGNVVALPTSISKLPWHLALVAKIARIVICIFYILVTELNEIGN